VLPPQPAAVELSLACSSRYPKPCDVRKVLPRVLGVASAYAVLLHPHSLEESTHFDFEVRYEMHHGARVVSVSSRSSRMRFGQALPQLLHERAQRAFGHATVPGVAAIVRIRPDDLAISGLSRVVVHDQAHHRPSNLRGIERCFESYSFLALPGLAAYAVGRVHPGKARGVGTIAEMTPNTDLAVGPLDTHKIIALGVAPPLRSPTPCDRHGSLNRAGRKQRIGRADVAHEDFVDLKLHGDARATVRRREPLKRVAAAHTSTSSICVWTTTPSTLAPSGSATGS